MKHSTLMSGLIVVWLLLAQSQPAALSAGSAAQSDEGRAVLQEAAAAMGGLEALRGIRNIRREGSVQRSALGQARVTRERLLVLPAAPTTQITDFTVPRHVVVGASGRPTQVADSNRGGYNDAQGLALRAMQPGALAEIRKEWDRDIARFPLLALGDGSEITGAAEASLDGRPRDVVTIRYVDGLTYKVFTDKASRLISKLEFTEDRNPYGDLVKERIFSDYRAVGNVKLPFSTVNTEMELPTLKQTWSKIEVNGAVPEGLFEIPADLREKAQALAHAATVPVIPHRLADGVYFGEGPGMNSMWVEFKDFVLVAEGPDHEMQSMETIRQIRSTVGDKPIRYLVTTHHHADHTGGIRTFAGEGAAIVTHANNEAVIREMLTRPHALKPDLLSKSGREPWIETVAERRTITDGARVVELMHVPNPHADGYLAIYLPQEKLLFESDMFQILQGQQVPPRVSPETKAFYEAVTGAGWQVERIAPGHGRLLQWQELVDAVATAK